MTYPQGKKWADLGSYTTECDETDAENVLQKIKVLLNRYFGLPKDALFVGNRGYVKAYYTNSHMKRCTKMKSVWSFFHGRSGVAQIWCTFKANIAILLKLKHSQYKNDATQLKNFLGLKLPPFFLHRVCDGKRRQFQNQKVFQLNRVFLILTAL